MSSLSLRVKYRPLRLGLCIRQDSLADLRLALRSNHVLWGGRYNPIIPVGAGEVCESLVECFLVDALVQVVDDPQILEFVNRFEHLPWPFLHPGLSIESGSRKVSTLLDLYHPIRQVFERYNRDVPEPRMSATLFSWAERDPLADVLLITCGDLPASTDGHIDYRRLITEYLAGETEEISAESPLPIDLDDRLTVSTLTAYQLETHYWDVDSWTTPGFYRGSSQDFTDLVNYWNLRAAGLDLLFYDPQYASRFDPLRDAFLAKLRTRPRRSSPWGRAVAVWSKEGRCESETTGFGADLILPTIGADTWNGLNLKPPTMTFADQSVLGSVSEGRETPSVSFQLPRKPFFDDFEGHIQHVVVSVGGLGGSDVEPDMTFRPPFIPEINEYLGRQCVFLPDIARAEVDGLGIVIPIRTANLTIRALRSRDLIAKNFEAFGFDAKPSQPGLIASRLIRQMGGLQGCRVFKIPGVRRLIEEYSPYQSFNRSAAVQTIGDNDPATGRPQFGPYESLVLEYGQPGKLKPGYVLKYLLKHGVFRIGLKLKCPNCLLDFWLPLDETKTFVDCQYCGEKFNATLQLEDRDWAYRRSGLFGREDHQEGGIPVALTLQQLETTLSLPLFSTAIHIVPRRTKAEACETDLVVVTDDHHGRVQLVIGECKTRGEINDKKISDLKAVADALPARRCDVFIVISKVSQFSEAELERLRTFAATSPHKLILLSERELDPYNVYAEAAKEFEVRASAVCLDDLARGTRDIFLEPKRRQTGGSNGEVEAT